MSLGTCLSPRLSSAFLSAGFILKQFSIVVDKDDHPPAAPTNIPPV